MGEEEEGGGEFKEEGGGEGMGVGMGLVGMDEE